MAGQRISFNAVKQRLKKQLGEISDNDQYHHQLLLDSWETYLAALDDVRKNGINIKGQNGLVRINPSMNAANEAHKQIVKLSKVFGIEPTNRAADRTDTDEMESIINEDE